MQSCWKADVRVWTWHQARPRPKEGQRQQPQFGSRAQDTQHVWPPQERGQVDTRRAQLAPCHRSRWVERGQRYRRTCHDRAQPPEATRCTEFCPQPLPEKGLWSGCLALLLPVVLWSLGRETDCFEALHRCPVPRRRKTWSHRQLHWDQSRHPERLDPQPVALARRVCLVLHNESKGRVLCEKIWPRDIRRSIGCYPVRVVLYVLHMLRPRSTPTGSRGSYWGISGTCALMPCS